MFNNLIEAVKRYAGALLGEPRKLVRAATAPDYKNRRARRAEVSMSYRHRSRGRALLDPRRRRRASGAERFTEFLKLRLIKRRLRERQAERRAKNLVLRKTRRAQTMQRLAA